MCVDVTLHSSRDLPNLELQAQIASCRAQALSYTRFLPVHPGLANLLGR